MGTESAGGARGLVVTGLSASYGAAEIIHDVSLTVAHGEVLSLLGRNGMGKTTLVRAILGLAPPTRHGGDVTWEGISMSRAASYRRARYGLGLVPQGRRVFGSLSVEENLTTTARRGTDDTAWGLERVYEFFPRLKERRKNKARNLSGGEQQMLAIGRALMTNPRLLIMDEPSEGLAPVVVEQIKEQLSHLKGSLSILLVEQNFGLAMSLADRVCILELGRIVYSGTPDELSNAPGLQRQYLGV